MIGNVDSPRQGMAAFMVMTAESTPIREAYRNWCLAMKADWESRGCPEGETYPYPYISESKNCMLLLTGFTDNVSDDSIAGIPEEFYDEIAPDLTVGEAKDYFITTTKPWEEEI